MNEKDLDLFERYYSGTCSEEEHKEIEARLESDPLYKKDYEAYCTSVFLLKKSAFKELVTQSKKARMTTSRWIPVIVLFLIGLLVILYLYSRTGPADSLEGDQLYAQYFEPLPNLFANRSGSDSLDLAMLAYENEDYIAVLKLLDTTKYRQPLTKVYRAISRLAVTASQDHSFEEEIEFLPEDHPFVEQVRWYSALNSLKSGNIKKAVIDLEQIKPDEYRYEEASALLQRIHQ